MASVTPCEKLAGMQPDRTRVGLPVSRTRRWLWAARAGLLAQGEFGSVGDVSADGFGLFPRVGAAVAHAAVVEGS